MKTKSSVHIPFIVILLSLILGSIVVQSAVLCTGFLKSMHSNSKENVIEISSKQLRDIYKMLKKLKNIK